MSFWVLVYEEDQKQHCNPKRTSIHHPPP